MRRGTPDHPKVADLAARLQIPQYSALGLLEALWHWAPRYAIQGDIGRWPDEAIAKGCFWDREPLQLIEALVASRWVDRVRGRTRLVIHDVADHADNSWRQALVDQGLKFWDGTPPRRENVGRPGEEKTPVKRKRNSRKTPEQFQENSTSFPSLPTTSQADPSPPEARAGETPPPHDAVDATGATPVSGKIPPGLAIVPALTGDGNFDRLMRVFAIFGKSWSARQFEKCAKLYTELSSEDQQASADYAELMARTEWVGRETRFIPAPWNYLTDQPWPRSRDSPPVRLVPVLSKADLANERAAAMLEAQERQ